jgi:hypothetical protein
MPLYQPRVVLGQAPRGLHNLAITVRNHEIDTSRQGISFATLSLEEKDQDIACAFHWFATSLVNYVRLIGFLDVMGQNGWLIDALVDNSKHKIVSEFCRNYVAEVIPNVNLWRHKVGAHFASTDPLNSDNIGTLQDSMLNPVTYQKQHYYAHAHTYARGSEQSKIPEWSLTEVFEQLQSRYWQGRSLPTIPPEQ